MFEELNLQLSQVRERVKNCERLKRLLERAEAHLYNEEQRLRDLKEWLEREDLDVKKLESVGVLSLFHAILGDKEQRLEKERQELLAARLKHEECLSTIDALKREIVEYESSLGGLGDPACECERLLEAKKEAILAAGDQNAVRLGEINDRMDELRIHQKELEEALRSGEDARQALASVLDSLDSARNWGTWDMLGGGMISTAIKHSRLDDASESANRAQYLLGRFERELKDVDLIADLNVELDSFTSFADYFFDGLIFDWTVQSRINDSLDRVEHVVQRLRIVLERLEDSILGNKREMEKLQNQMNQILENT